MQRFSKLDGDLRKASATRILFNTLIYMKGEPYAKAVLGADEAMGKMGVSKDSLLKPLVAKLEELQSDPDKLMADVDDAAGAAVMGPPAAKQLKVWPGGAAAAASSSGGTGAAKAASVAGSPPAKKRGLSRKNSDASATGSVAASTSGKRAKASGSGSRGKQPASPKKTASLKSMPKKH